MKESISYTFVLNIVILFIFICFAIILGIFSYYRAFKAGVIIVDSIEKYEGYNCLSAEEIGKKLSTISYNVPFDANCNKADGSPCMTDANKNYAVISYNLSAKVVNYTTSNQVTEEDLKKGQYVAIRGNNSGDNDYRKMNSEYYVFGGHVYTKEYQYGVVTYMYVDLPVVSNLLKLTVYSKTRKLYEFRQLLDNDKENGNYSVYDSRLLPDGERLLDLFTTLNSSYAKSQIGGLLNLFDEEYNARMAFKYDPSHDGVDKLSDDKDKVIAGFPYSCGAKVDYSLY